MKQNVLTLITSSYGGGAERLVLDQMHFFNQKQFNLHVITFRPGQLEKDFKNTSDVLWIIRCYHGVRSRLETNGAFAREPIQCSASRLSPRGVSSRNPGGNRIP